MILPAVIKCTEEYTKYFVKFVYFMLFRGYQIDSINSAYLLTKLKEKSTKIEGIFGFCSYTRSFKKTISTQRNVKIVTRDLKHSHYQQTDMIDTFILQSLQSWT